MIIRDLFLSDVTRDIPPVVYFHEQTPEKLASEVSEYIITGGWPEDHPNHRRVPRRHPRAVREAAAGDRRGAGQAGRARAAERLDLRVLRLGKVELRQALRARPRRRRAARRQLARGGSAPPRPDPAVGRTPDSLERAAAGRSTRSRSSSTSAASPATTSTSTPRPSGRSRSGSATARPSRSSPTSSCKLERDDEWKRFEETAARVLGRPWAEREGQAARRGGLLARPLRALSREVHRPDELVHEPRRDESRRASRRRTPSPPSATCSSSAGPGATLFLVVDEVSQYVLSNKDRVDRLRAFATALGSGAQGQGLARRARAAEARRGGRRLLPRLGEGPFPAQAPRAPRRDEHPRRRPPAAAPEAARRGRRSSARCSRSTGPTSSSIAYGCDQITADEFVEVYPMLPGHVDLLLQITTALRTRSARAQGDDQAIRGLLQLLGELFRDRKLADMEVGSLVTLDQVYEVQHTALDSDVQASMARILNQCAERPDRPPREGGEGGGAPRAHPGRPCRPTRSSSRSASTTGSIAATR